VNDFHDVRSNAALVKFQEEAAVPRDSNVKSGAGLRRK
jgi:hypothetical protein